MSALRPIERSTPRKAHAAGGLDGNQLYQQRARVALPLLVRQALSRRPITYGDLARKIRMSNARNLNYVLGCVGGGLLKLGDKWGEKIPPVQILVINKVTREPGAGFDGFLRATLPARMLGKRDRRVLLRLAREEVYNYNSWLRVLRAFNLAPPAAPSDLLDSARRPREGGEGQDHQVLKKFVAEHPEILGLPRDLRGELEYALPSGDFVDVMFRGTSKWHAVEVKPVHTDPGDILRGLFQCVKYQAVTRAWLRSRLSRAKVTTALALGGVLPDELTGLRKALGVKVFQGIAAIGGDRA